MNICLKLSQILLSVVGLVVLVTGNLAKEENYQSYLIPSIFDKFPPYIRFPPLNRCQRMPPEIKKSLYWPTEYYRQKQIVEAVARCAGINIIPARTIRNCESIISKGYMLGSYISYCATTKWQPKLQNFTKIRILPEIPKLDNKLKIRTLYKKLERRLGAKLPWLIQSYNLPWERKQFQAHWARDENKYWVSKPPNGVVALGIKIISHPNEIPKNKQVSVQKYIHNPYLYQGRKVELRSWYLITGFNPLRVYQIHQFDRFKQQFSNFTMDPNSFKDRCVHIRSRRFPECGWRKEPEYDRPTIANIFNSIEKSGGNVSRIYDELHSLVITTLLEWENQVLAKNHKHRFGNYMVLSFDCFIDDNFKLWLNEVNWRPGVFPFPRFYRNFGQIYNILGINFPPILSKKAQKILKEEFIKTKGLTTNTNFPIVHYNFHSCDNNKTSFQGIKSFDDLNNCEIRLLALIEDELSRVKPSFAKRIFPSDTIHQYYSIINPDHRNVYQVLQMWESKYKHQRRAGRKYLNDRLNNDTTLVF